MNKVPRIPRKKKKELKKKGWYQTNAEYLEDLKNHIDSIKFIPQH
jgi:hypothetical protein